MSAFDACHLGAEAQQKLRRRVIHAVVDLSLKPAVAARLFGVGRTSIYHWRQDYYTGGYRTLASPPRGRPHEGRLQGHQAATIVRLITRRYPSQIRLPFALWTREAVQQLIAPRTDLHLSVWTVGRYLKHWGFTPQKPLRRAYEQDPQAVRRWLEEAYPALREQAKQEKQEMLIDLRAYMRSTQRQPGIVKSYFRHPSATYAQGLGCSLFTARGNMAKTCTRRWLAASGCLVLANNPVELRLTCRRDR
jgi:transposase